MTSDLNPCPFCGGKARLTFKDYRFGGRNSFGEKRIKYRIQVICNKCNSRGKPVITSWLIDPNPWNIPWLDELRFMTMNNYMRVQAEMWKPYVEEAIVAWNRRTGK